MASEVRARLGSQQACGTTCKQSCPPSPSSRKMQRPRSSCVSAPGPAGSVQLPPPHPHGSSSVCGAGFCSCWQYPLLGRCQESGDEKEARTRGKCQAVSMRLNHVIHWFQVDFVSFLPFFPWLFPSDVDCKGVTEIPSEFVLLEPRDGWALGSHRPVLRGVRGWGGNASWPGLPLLAEPWSLLFLLNCKEKDSYGKAELRA